MSNCRKPCRTCPWRKEQHADEIPNFNLELAERLVDTTRDGDLNAPIFACHQSRPEQEIVCVGWLWRYGWNNIQIRFMLVNDRIKPEELEIDPAFDGVLHETFEEVITKLREDEAEHESVEERS